VTGRNSLLRRKTKDEWFQLGELNKSEFLTVWHFHFLFSFFIRLFGESLRWHFSPLHFLPLWALQDADLNAGYPLTREEARCQAGMKNDNFPLPGAGLTRFTRKGYAIRRCPNSMSHIHSYSHSHSHYVQVKNCEGSTEPTPFFGLGKCLVNPSQNAG